MKNSFSPDAVPHAAAAPTDTPLPRIVIRMPGLQQIYPVGRTTIYALIKAKKLPRPIALSKRARGWVLSEVEECIARLKAEASDE